MKKVIMLNSQDKLNLDNQTLFKTSRGYIKQWNKFEEKNENPQDCTPQHLYIIDTEAEIVEGEICNYGKGLFLVEKILYARSKADINNKIKIIGKFVHDMSYCEFESWSSLGKIIATTNPKLGLPLINKEFIQLFVEKQGKIDEVDVQLSGCVCYENCGKPECKESCAKYIPYGDLAIVTPKESDDVESAAYEIAKEIVTHGCNFEVGSGQWRSKVDMNAKSVKAGAQWQKERSYSKEEIIKLLELYDFDGGQYLLDFIEKNLKK